MRPEKCGKCGKKVVPCAEGCKGRTCSEGHKLKSKSESKGDSKDGSEKSDAESGEKGGSGWTEEQNSKIKQMKGENKSWKDIALEVGASKKDVQNRYKELTKNSSSDAKEKKDQGKDENGWESGGGSGWGDEGRNDGGNMPDFGALFVDDVEEAGAREQPGGGNQGQEQNKNNGGTGGGSGKKQKNQTSKQNNNNIHGGGGQKSQGGSFSDVGNPFDDPPEETPKGKLRPDGAWTEDDCEILEYLRNKYEENKWLHMQAGFYNWTGRMVIAQLIEQKFKDDGAA